MDSLSYEKTQNTLEFFFLLVVVEVILVIASTTTFHARSIAVMAAVLVMQAVSL